jgi:hypothetical protein
MIVQNDLQIPYEKILADFPKTHSASLSTELISTLENVWLNRYCKMSPHKPNVLQFQDHGYTFLYDQTSAGDSNVDDRLVVGYGYSMVQPKKRDAHRIQGLLGGKIEIPGKGVFDKGHVLAHSMGGGTDVNLFPQQPELNRGRSDAGKIYRSMEKYAAQHPNTFVFSRLLYSDASWLPFALEYGVLRPEYTFWIEHFSNEWSASNKADPSNP